MLKGKRENLMELLFQERRKNFMLFYSQSQFKESICFNTQLSSKPQIYIGLGEKKIKMLRGKGFTTLKSLNSI